MDPTINTLKYYFRDINPTHDQPGTGKGEKGDHKDAKALVFQPPTEMEYWKCARWVQSSPDEIAENMSYPLILKSIDTYFWYMASDFLLIPIAKMGIEKKVTYGTICNIYKRLEPTEKGDLTNQSDYMWTHKKISSLSWQMVSQESWYFLSIKIMGDQPRVMTIPEQPSYAEFSYLYYDGLNIKSNSNENIKILSVTSPVENSNKAEIIFEGAGFTEMVIEMPKKVEYSVKFDNNKCTKEEFNQEKGILNLKLDLSFTNSIHKLEICEKQNLQNRGSISFRLYDIINKIREDFSFIKIRNLNDIFN
jgi:hypothetical protein